MRAVYRLQLRPGFGFREARALVPYLRELGVSHLYLSPSLQARPGSEHGYDVIDPTRISDDLGGEGAFRDLCAAGLDVLLDIVPNHMAADDANPFWPDPKFFDGDPETGWHRRFFDIDDLAGVRQEDPEVFEVTHQKVLELVREGLVDGLRIDHVDGLARPGEYLDRLRDRGAERVWVEKILEPDEELRYWPVEGTTGYEFANDVTALFVDPRGERPLTELYGELTGERRRFAEVADEAKLEQARTTFRPEVELLSRLSGIAFDELAGAVASLPVYRTYLDGGVEADDEDVIGGSAMSDRVAHLLVSQPSSEFTTRFQQLSGAVMAKGVEDTAFYGWLRLVALNEVGGDPGRFSLPVEEFHRASLRRAERFPRHLVATQTHDTKRSGDVRARIGALAGLADEWAERVRLWRALDDANGDYLLWQTLVGAWPIERDRLEAYMEKALREAKVNTSWTRPNEAHEARVRSAIGRLYERLPDDFEPFAARVAEAGRHASLGQTLLKLTVPGVPDVYQGDELECLSLVDPDNRRPVDWERRRRLISSEEPSKLLLIRRTLALRARREEDFAGSYEPVDAGPDVCAFRRGDGVFVAVPLRPGVAADAGPSGPGWVDLLPEFPGRLCERQ
ncbi:MAG TPA: malto-oligosyltrehalose synthase [Gaiellaceae bacterium]